MYLDLINVCKHSLTKFIEILVLYADPPIVVKLALEMNVIGLL